MAKILNKEPAVYRQEQENFVRELRKFHEQKGTGFKHIPCILGKEIDLYLLYWLVTSQGGWEKVNSRDGWDDLLETFDLPPSTSNGSLSLKQTYLRYLDAYEKYYFLGEEEEEDSNLFYDEEDQRQRRQRALRIVQSVPSTYNEGQHRIAENLRAHYGLSTDIYHKTDYDRLTLSLLSPLPNEQDFAINVCTLLSNEGRHTLKLGKCPRLLDLLLAHAGVFNHNSLRIYTTDTYNNNRNYDLERFWKDVCREKSILDLIYDENNFLPKGDKEEETEGEPTKQPSKSPPKEIVSQPSVVEEEHGDGPSRIAALRKKAEAELEDGDDELFASGRGNGTKELTGQRILQVATVIRNLSFEEDNSPVLAKNLTCLRFVLLCVNSSWANLNQMGFDILSNIAAEIHLEEPSDDAVTELLLSTLSRCIGAQDRFQVISSLDVLNKLCGQQVNEDFIQRLLEQAVYGQLTEYLSLHDIHLLITVLECLYSLTSLGELPCNALVKTHSAVELLVSLVTVEAQSYGPKACILMRVVETVPGTTAQGAPATTQPQTTPQSVAISRSTGSPVMLTQAGQTMSQASTGPTILPRPALVQGGAPRPMAPGIPGGTAPTPAAAPTRPQGAPGSQQVQLRVSNDEPHRVFCLSWLKATYEPCSGKSIEQNIMYKQYLASMHRMGRKEVISAQHYALCIRTLFGGSTGPNKKAVGDKVENHYTGIQVRAQPLPLKLTPAQAAAAQEASRAQGGAPVNGVAGRPQGQQQQQQQQQQQMVQVNSQGQVVQQQGQQVAQKVMVNSQGQLVDAQGRLVQISGGQVFQGQKVVHVNQQGQQVVSVNNQQGVNAQGQRFMVNSQGQPVITVNNQGQQVALSAGGGQVVQGGQMVQLNAQGQQVMQVNQQGQQQVVQVNPQGQQMVQVNQQGQIVKQISPSNVVTLNQQGQVVQQRIVNSSGQIVAQGMVQGGTVMSQGMAPRAPVVVQAGQPRQLVQRIVQPGAGGQQQVVVAQGTQQQQPNFQMTAVTGASEDLENGASVLDGILPVDPKFGQLEGDLGLGDLLNERKDGMVNGHMPDFSKMNGEKRSAAEVESHPAKRQAVEGVITNGVMPSNGVNGGGVARGGQGMVIVSQSGGAQQPMQGQLVKSSTGQLFLKTTSSSGGAVLVPAGQQTQQGQVLMQPGPQKLLLVNQGGRQVVVGGQQGQQSVVRVAAPMAAVPTGEQHVTQIDGAEALPQLDGTGDEVPTPLSSSNPTTSPSISEASSADSAPPTTAVLVASVTNGRSTPSTSGTPPPCSPTPSPSPPPSQPAIKIDTTKPFLCEWAGCMKAFKTPKEVENHAIAEHCPLGGDDIPCLWARCDGMRRKRFSLMTHLQDRHCHPQLMKLMAVRRVQIAQSGKSDVPLPPAPPPHPGYAPNAALHAIKRHAVEFVSPKELAMRDEKEGPVTKSIRLTASLILRNLVIYSSLGRSRLRAYESHLSTVALSNVESSRTVSQILFDLANSNDFQQ